uniref:FLYWCH-type domain-containing protein n=1 Tax=Parastrongyloides trichosuri TaxID=131310 RepID=A0A0N4ZBW3_PARTI
MVNNEILSAMSPSVRPYLDRKRIDHAKSLINYCLVNNRHSRKKINNIVMLLIYCEVHPKRLITTGAYGTLRSYLKFFKKKADFRAKNIYRCWKPGCKEYMKENNVDHNGQPLFKNTTTDED